VAPRREQVPAGSHGPDIGSETVPADTRFALFAYVAADKAPLYQALMAIALEASQRYRLGLTPGAFVTRLHERPDLLPDGYILDEEGVETALLALCRWGNLKPRFSDRIRFTMAEYLRKQDEYVITPGGEAAERAIGDVLRTAARTGSLNPQLLSFVRDAILALEAEACSGQPQPGGLYASLIDVNGRFLEMSGNARTFMNAVHRVLDVADAETEEFDAYIGAIASYVHDFVGELGRLEPLISAAVRNVEAAGLGRILDLAAAAEESPLEGSRARAREKMSDWWSGVQQWFLGRPGQPPIVEELYGSGRRAVAQALHTVARVREHHEGRVSRAQDLLRLAGHFAEAAAEDECHALFATAFGLWGSRHLAIVDDEQREAPASASWWSAPPAPVAPVLRAGGSARSGRTPALVDRRAAHEKARRRLEEEAASRLVAFAPLLDRGAMQLSALPAVSLDTLAAIIGVIDQLVLVPGAASELDTVTPDGFRVRVAAPPPASREAVIETAGGHLRMPDYIIDVRSAAVARSVPAVGGEEHTA
jgi:uncharacterized protein (TIGR02677 family)